MAEIMAITLFVSICIALAIFNAVLATVLQNARVAFSTGRDGTWPRPINRQLAAVHARYQSPWMATLVAGFTSMALCFLGLDLILVLMKGKLVFLGPPREALRFFGVEEGSNGSISTTQPKRFGSFGVSRKSKRGSASCQR